MSLVSEVAALKPYPSAVTFMMDWLESNFAALAPTSEGVRVSTDLPSPGVPLLPYVQVFAVSGTRDRRNAYPVIDVSVFGSSYVGAETLAEQIDAALLGYPLTVSSGGRSVLVDRVDVVSNPVELPWDTESTARRFRFQATYQLSLRR